ncbi:MAG: hypothetical protein P8M04_02425 [Akkermansiaceae bacterium]|nr:hypothetical protein [Akkermansiaceae bacterium]
MKFQIPFLGFILAVLPLSLTADERHTPPPPFEPTFPWITDLDQALQQSKQTGKPILAEFR